MWLEYAASVDVPRTLLADDAQAHIEMRHRPLGAVAAILPWNFPVVMTVTKLAPALRVGNTAVVKPSPFTPFAALRLGEVLNEVLPPGVVNVVSGGNELGAQMTAHPTPRKVSFTGSIASGKRVAVAAGSDLKRVTLELGGNDAAILLDDIDIVPTVNAVLARAWFNAGQACALPKRIFAPGRIYDEVVDAFTAAARALRARGAERNARRWGRCRPEPQFRRVCELVADAIDQGLSPTTGGGPADRARLLVRPDDLRRRRTRRPARGRGAVRPGTCRSFATSRSTRRWRRRTTRCSGSAVRSGARISTAPPRSPSDSSAESRTSTHTASTVPDMPLLGSKWSGIGMEHGIEGMLEFTDAQVVYRARRLTDTALT